MFINKNADLLINMLPEGATASGTATGVPNTLLKAFYTKTDRAKMVKTGSRAGLPIQVKNKNKAGLWSAYYTVMNLKYINKKFKACPAFDRLRYDIPGVTDSASKSGLGPFGGGAP